MHMHEKKGELVQHKGNGRDAYAPHEIFQHSLFCLSRQRTGREHRQQNNLVWTKTNTWGDEIAVRAARTLWVRPDMPVFLAAIATMQKPGRIREYFTPGGIAQLSALVPLSDLYALTGMTSKNRSRLFRSLDAIGSVSMAIKYSAARRFIGYGWTLKSFWDYSEISRRGRSGSLIEFRPAHILIPREKSLYADARVANRLKSDTAAAIFWSLICREHYSGNASEWLRLIGANVKRSDKWVSRQLYPALEELAAVGYKITDGLQDDGIITITRPKKRLTALA